MVLLHVGIALNALRTVARHSGDFDRFWTIARSAGLPYRDYPVEYPPGTVALFSFVGTLTSGQGSFRAVLILVNVAADAVVIGMLMWGWNNAAALYYALVVAPILPLLFFRVDLWSMAVTVAAVAAWQRDRRYVGALGVAAGTALKLWPLPFAVLLAADRKDGDRALLLFGSLAAITIGCWWLVAGNSGFHQVLTFREAHGWHIETIVGGLLRLADPSAVRLESGALRIGSISEAAEIALLSSGGCLMIAAVWTGAIRNAIGCGWLAGIVGLLLLSPLLSPQFLGWILPGAAIAWAQGARRPAVLVAVAVLMTPVYQVHMSAPGVVARDAVLVAVAVSAFVDLRRAYLRPRAATG